MNRSLVAAIALGLAGSVFAQGPGSGPGAGPADKGGPRGPGAAQGAGPGKGAAKGPAMRFGADNTRGWSMMSRTERNDHRNRMLSMTTLADCKAFQEEHRKQMEARAKERGRSIGPGPRTDMCERMQAAGRLK